MGTATPDAQDGTFAALRGQLRDAAERFAEAPGAAADILAGMVDDVDRALAEELEIFPVCHHSPASALAMARRLREKRPKVVYLELCEDMRPLLDELRNCRLPVALQAFASDVQGFDPEWAPLSVVAPITEASAEYQAIAYALETPGVELVAVDWSTDHVFQWEESDPAARRTAADPDAAAASRPGDEEDSEEDGESALHGDAVGIELGDLRPGFAELEEYLLHHGRVRHWSEWWDQYVEQPLSGAGYDAYRQAMLLVGSLFRRLRDTGDLRRSEERERFMWTRMRQHLAASELDAGDALYVCGALHAASRVEQFGARSDAPYEIAERTGTRWLHGLIPSSHSAIEAQFGLARGSVSIAAATWEKALKRSGVAPFRLAGQKGTSRKAPKAAPVSDAPAEDRLSGFLTTPPEPGVLDEQELLTWAVDIVRLARRNGYMASTADAIAVVETSVLLAGVRGRNRPTPYDFQDAAITCIEKDTVPGRRDVRRLCEILLGGDRVGQVGYAALPPLAQNVLDRLEPLGVDLTKRTVQRALLDLRSEPRLQACSDVLWILHRMLPDGIVRPIMGSRRLGERSVQESWDLSLGRDQRWLVELGYEGVTIEQVLEQRLRKIAWAPDATASAALGAVEDALVLLGNRRFVDELGARAVELLSAERTVDDAPDVLKRVRRLLAHYRASEPELPAWCKEFVTEGYAHYCTLLPTAFTEDETGVRQVAAMLGFLFGMESLALSLGCDHAQLEIAVAQSHPEAPAKVALLWAARVQLGVLSRSDLRERCDEMLGNPLVVPAFPHYLSGFVHALEPVPTFAPFVVEVMSKAFGSLPDHLLLPWLPRLVMTLREHAAELVPVLTREAGRTFPGSLPALDAWTPPWEAVRPREPDSRAGVPSAPSGPVAELLAAHPAACDAAAALFGLDPVWQAAPAGPASASSAASELLGRHPDAAGALAALLTR
ncbi:DUF5682 family protein [Actinomadura harenae]|uniref:Uncharacterized protein n=1 Tax=Actinomadura harenae TaxID=2483351 RepID=A0A3M2LKS3_9ACTN|nr:DUF5682 family protein [Actinomadura harenae]RMI37430.1 hypothetical protein EBO15_35945 [Actinomadura harenae]